MEKLTVKQYAQKHKLSIYNVIKMTRTGALKSEKIEENGKEIVYILTDDGQENAVAKQIIPQNPPKSLKEENMLLKVEIQRLKEALEKCQKER